jgi:hypothetical protein
MRNLFKMSALSVTLAAGIGLSMQAQAVTVLVDDFTQDLTVSKIGSGSSTSGAHIYAATTLLGTPTRNLTVNNPTNGITNAVINTLTPGALDIGTQSTNATVTLDYLFSATDLTDAGANAALILQVLSIDPNGVTVNMDVTSGSGTSTSGAQTFFNTGLFFRNFVDFTGTADFTQATQLTITLTGVNADWDGKFDFIQTAPTPTPEPTSMALFGIGAMAFAARRRRSA